MKWWTGNIYIYKYIKKTDGEEEAYRGGHSGLKKKSIS